MTHTNVIFFLLSSEKPILESLYFYFFFSCVVFGPGHPSPGLGCSECRFCTNKQKKKTHTYTQERFPAQELRGEGRGPCRRLGPAAQASASGVYIAVSTHPQSPSCNVLLFVVVEQLCVNISKSLKKPETQPYPVLVISPPCGSQAFWRGGSKCLDPFGEAGARQGAPSASEGQVPSRFSRQGVMGLRAPRVQRRLPRPGSSCACPGWLPVSLLVARWSPCLL